MPSAAVETLGHYLGRIFFTVVVALLLYFVVKVARKIFKVRDVEADITLWFICFV